MARSLTYLINGSFDHAISPFDRGFAYGDGVFRTLVMREGVPESWPQHYQKLVADCAAINIVCPSAELLMSDLQQLFLLDEVAVAKIIITRGEGNRGYTPPPITAPMRVVTKSAMPQYAEERFSQGVNLIVCETRLALQPRLAGVKHLNRLENVLARMEWNEQTFNDLDIADGILLDTNKNVIECTAANIFARFGDTLVTPNLEECGVAGITRQRIIALADTISLNVAIETFDLQKLFAADEVVICNSIYGAWQVKSVQLKSGQAKNMHEKTFQSHALAANIRAAFTAYENV